MLRSRDIETMDASATALFYEMRKMEKRETMSDVNRMLEKFHKGEEKKKYWVETIRHYNQKKCSFFVTSVLAAKKISVPLR